MIKFFYITNNPIVAQIAEEAGVDRIFIDMEFIGKDIRQGGLDTVQNHHTVDDVVKIKQCLKRAKLLVRINPMHISSKEEIDNVVNAGADIIMLPFFKSADEVGKFLQFVGGRTKTILLVETKEAVDAIDEILEFREIDEVYIGLNDLHLTYGMNFMFELLANGTVDQLVKKFKCKGLPYGFGGIARLGEGLLPAEYVLAEHYRLGSTRAILARAFCNYNKVNNEVELRETFNSGMKDLRVFESNLACQSLDFFDKNRVFVKKAVENIVELAKHKQ